MFTLKRLLLLVALVAGGGFPESRAQAPVEARIMGIKATTDVVVVESTFRSLENRRLPKFTPEGRRVPQAVLLVDWQTVRALPAGVLVQFSYRQPGSEAVRKLDRRYDRAVTGRQQTRFAVTMSDPERDRVSAWRVQVLYQGQVLDEQRSAAWR